MICPSQLTHTVSREKLLSTHFSLTSVKKMRATPEGVQMSVRFSDFVLGNTPPHCDNKK